MPCFTLRLHNLLLVSVWNGVGFPMHRNSILVYNESGLWKNCGKIAGGNMIFTPQGRGPHWPPEYIAYAVELQRQYDARLINVAEVESRLQARYPDKPAPDPDPAWVGTRQV